MPSVLSRSIAVPLVITTVISGVTAALIYLLLREDPEENALDHNKVATSRYTVQELRIPKTVVAQVIGRQGVVIKEIQASTETKINFKDELTTETERVCCIRGKPENVQEAKLRIQSIISDVPVIETIYVKVPQHCCGRIIGKGGENIREMCQVSGAKVIVDRSRSGAGDSIDSRTVTIHGTKQQVALARDMVEECVGEEEARRNRIHLSTANRTPRYRHRPNADTVNEDSVPEVVTLEATAADGFVEVYISAVDTAAHFWVQVVSPQAVELDKMVEDMTRLYNVQSNRDVLRLDKVEVGDLVAAPFPGDSSWYRAIVKKVISREDPLQCEVTVYYVDFGDTDTVNMKDVYRLGREYRTLKQQAVECCLANVKPSGGESWSEEAGDAFEALTYAAQWKVMMLRAVSHTVSASGSSIPSCELIDTSLPQDVNVATELINRGFAIKDDSRSAKVENGVS